MSGTVISIDGLDKTGKSTLVKYLRVLSDFRLVVNDRGIVHCLALAHLRGKELDVDLAQFKGWTFVCLTCDEEDRRIRCAITGERMVPYGPYKEAWDYAFTKVGEAGARVLRYDTSKMTPFAVAKAVMKEVEG